MTLRIAGHVPVGSISRALRISYDAINTTLRTTLVRIFPNGPTATGMYSLTVSSEPGPAVYSRTALSPMTTGLAVPSTGFLGRAST